jgi:Tol biopolymer transport system component
MRPVVHTTLFAALVVAAPPLAAQRSAEKVPPFHTKLFVTDSLSITDPALSPDGRWVVFGTYDFGHSNLWMSSIKGGAPIALTAGSHVDGVPAWFPAGDRIAFVSDRTNGVMTLGIDPRTGHAVGAPRRVTLDNTDRFALSSDGARIAYVTTASGAQKAVRLVAATGGRATTLAQFGANANPTSLAFSPDDRFLYFVIRDYDIMRPTVVRVPTAGGPVERVVDKLVRPGAGKWTVPLPGIQQVFQMYMAGNRRRAHLVSFTGDTTAEFQVGTAQSGNPGQAVPTGDGSAMLTATEKFVAPIRLIALDGSARTISEGREYEWPVGWSPDGRRVRYSTREDSSWTMASADLDGSHRQVESFRPTNLAIAPWAHATRTAVSPDGRYVKFSVDSMNHPAQQFVYVVDMQTKLARRLTDRDDPTLNLPLTAGGDWYGMNHGEFVYTEIDRDNVELRAATPSGTTRLVRSFPRASVRRSHVAVEGDLVAYTESHDDSSTVYAAHGAAGDASPVLTVLGNIDEIVISPDATMIAAIVYGRDITKQTNGELALIPIAAPAQTRFIATGDGGYEAVWTRDSKAVFYLKADKNWAQTSVWRYPVRGDEPPRNLTKNETSLMWGYQLSPDGRAILVPAEHGRGSTLWRIDLKQAMSAYAASRAKTQQAGKAKP